MQRKAKQQQEKNDRNGDGGVMTVTQVGNAEIPHLLTLKALEILDKKQENLWKDSKLNKKKGR